jgi:hypothetical protein
VDGAGRSQICRAGSQESASSSGRSGIGVSWQNCRPGALETLPPQLQLRSFVPCLVVFPHRPIRFGKPSAHFVPFIVRVGESVGLLTAGTFHRLLVRKRVADCGLAIHDFCERDHALAFYPQSRSPSVQLAGFAAQSPRNASVVTSNVTSAPKSADCCSRKKWETD